MDSVSPYAAAIRDLAVGRVRDYDRRLRRFDEAAWHRYAELLDTVFLLAVDRRFRPGQDCGPIIRFVASVRERYDHSGTDIDPATAEALIQAALGQCEPLELDASTVAAQTMLVLGLLDDEGMSSTELTAFLRTAEQQCAPAGLMPAGTGSADDVDRPRTRGDGHADEAEPEAEPGVPGRRADDDARFAPRPERDVAGEERDRRQAGDGPGVPGEVFDHLEAGGDGRHQLHHGADPGEGGVDGDRAGER
jgi:hypothetical protein